jgi:hypothetical protein
MSQSTAVRTARAARPARAVPRHPGRPVPGQARTPQPPPRLRVVTAARHTRSRAGLVVICVALLALGLVGLLLLDVGLERGAYDLRDQSSRAEQLREQEQKLRMEIVEQAAPQNLETKARSLGMVPTAAAPVFVLPNGRRIGVPQRAVKTQTRNVTPTTDSSPPTRRPAAPAPATTTGPAPAPRH